MGFAPRKYLHYSEGAFANKTLPTVTNRRISHALMEGHSSLPVLYGVSMVSGLIVGFVTNNHLVGVIGPNRMFGPGAIYTNIQWFWLIGALLPVAFYVIIRVFPRSKLRFLNAPV